MDRRKSLLELAARFPINQPWAEFDARYVALPHAVGDNVADALVSEPAGSHVIVGAIGSGKSTELRRAATRLQSADPDRIVVCADADLLGDGLDAPGEGTLTRKVLDALVTHLSEHPRSLALAGLQVLSRVRARLDRERSGEEAPLDPAVTSPEDDLSTLRRSLGSCRVAVLLDSFDRVLPPRYAQAIEGALSRLRSLDVGLAITAPVDHLYAHWRDTLQRFSAPHVIGALDLSEIANAAALSDVLARRDPQDLLASPVRAALVESSSGHLRTLIQCAQRAVQLALRDDARPVAARDVERAAAEVRAFLASGLDAAKVKLLEELVRGQQPTMRDELVELVRSARVFDMGMGNYRVHGLLAPRAARRVA